jgi:hypothetical protein
VVLVTGEAGMGKTTLVDHFVTQMAPTIPGWTTRGQCIVFARARGPWPIGPPTGWQIADGSAASAGTELVGADASPAGHAG